MKRIEKIQKLMREKNGSPLNVEKEVVVITNSLNKELDENIEYSLDVDPSDKYHFSDIEKQFIRYYVKYKNVQLAANLSCLDIDSAMKIFSKYSTEQEIRRLNRALYLRQFNHKMLTIEQLGGWLSSLITDENVPDADRLKTTDKLRVAQMLIDLNDFRKNALDNPSTIMSISIEEQLKNISVDTIKQLIYTTNITNNTDKSKILDELKATNNLTVEEVAYLKTLSMNDLLDIVNTTINSKEENSNDTK